MHLSAILSKFVESQRDWCVKKPEAACKGCLLGYVLHTLVMCQWLWNSWGLRGQVNIRSIAIYVWDQKLEWTVTKSLCVCALDIQLKFLEISLLAHITCPTCLVKWPEDSSNKQHCNISIICFVVLYLLQCLFVWFFNRMPWYYLPIILIMTKSSIKTLLGHFSVF